MSGDNEFERKKNRLLSIPVVAVTVLVFLVIVAVFAGIKDISDGVGALNELSLDGEADRQEKADAIKTGKETGQLVMNELSVRKYGDDPDVKRSIATRTAAVHALLSSFGSNLEFKADELALDGPNGICDFPGVSLIKNEIERLKDKRSADLFDLGCREAIFSFTSTVAARQLGAFSEVWADQEDLMLISSSLESEVRDLVDDEYTFHRSDLNTSDPHVFSVEFSFGLSKIERHYRR